MRAPALKHMTLYAARKIRLEMWRVRYAAWLASVAKHLAGK